MCGERCHQKKEGGEGGVKRHPDRSFSSFTSLNPHKNSLEADESKESQVSRGTEETVMGFWEVRGRRSPAAILGVGSGRKGTLRTFPHFLLAPLPPVTWFSLPYPPPPTLYSLPPSCNSSGHFVSSTSYTIPFATLSTTYSS